MDRDEKARLRADPERWRAERLAKAPVFTCGIYVIRHKATGWCYIGMSGHIEERWKQHRCLLKHGKHSCRPLQIVWSRDGAGAFAFEILEKLPHYDRAVLGAREGHYYRLLEAVDIWNVDLKTAGYL